VAIANQYDTDLASIGWEGILDPKRIAADKTFEQSKSMLKAAREASKQKRARVYSLLDGIANGISSLNIGESTKRAMTQGLAKGIAESKRVLEALLTLDERILTGIENIINLLSARKGSWAIYGEQIRFRNDTDLNKMNSLVESLAQIENEQQELEAKLTDSLSKHLGNWGMERK
jgi:hypothetical protein